MDAPPGRRDVVSERFPEALASGRWNPDHAPEPVAAAPNQALRSRTLGEQLQENKMKAEEEYLDKYKYKGPKALDDEEYEFLEGTNMADLRRRLAEDARERAELAAFHAQKASLVVESPELPPQFLTITRPDLPDVAKKQVAAAQKKQLAIKVVAVEKKRKAEEGGKLATATVVIVSGNNGAAPKNPPPAPSAPSSSPSSSSSSAADPSASDAAKKLKPDAKPAAPSSASLSLLGGYGDSDEEK